MFIFLKRAGDGGKRDRLPARNRSFHMSQAASGTNARQTAGDVTDPKRGRAKLAIEAATIQAKVTRLICALLMTFVSEGRPARSYSSPWVRMRSQKCGTCHRKKSMQIEASRASSIAPPAAVQPIAGGIMPTTAPGS